MRYSLEGFECYEVIIEKSELWQKRIKCKAEPKLFNESNANYSEQLSKPLYDEYSKKKAAFEYSIWMIWMVKSKYFKAFVVFKVI